MLVYAGMDPRLPVGEVPAAARRAEALGFDGLQISETIHDSLAVSLLAIEHTSWITVRTSVAVAFVRSPTLTAYTAWDLAAYSGGRFELGLGTQIRQNIEDRYAMPWADPVPRMAEYLDVVEACFAAFASGATPKVEGAHYRIRRMQPYFHPGPDPDTTAPALWLGGVNPGICRLAGQRAAGFITHPTNSSPRFIDAVTRPNLAEGARRAGRPVHDIGVVCATPVITGRDDEALAAELERQRKLLAFLYSTPAYERTLELYGWAGLGAELRRLIRDDAWHLLDRLVTDEMLQQLAPIATYDTLAATLLARYEDRATGIVLLPPADPADDGRFIQVIDALQAGTVTVHDPPHHARR